MNKIVNKKLDLDLNIKSNIRLCIREWLFSSLKFQNQKQTFNVSLFIKIILNKIFFFYQFWKS